MASRPCELCSAPVANPEGEPVICERCFASRKVLVADESSGDLAALPPDRIQFACPSCKSLLQLPPVKKKTRVKCPKCQSDFFLDESGRVEANRSTNPLPGAQEKLLEGLAPTKNLDALLERVPAKKGEALPSVLTDSEKDEGYDLLPESSASNKPLDFKSSDATEASTVAPAPKSEPPKPKTRIATARRPRENVYEQRKEREKRAERAAQAQKYTLALLEQQRKRTLAAVRLFALVLLPLLPSAAFLASTTSEAGFAVRGKLGAVLTDLGDVARRGVQGLEALVSGS